ncbi:MAG: ABC transporter substrate-binding protein [Sphingomonadales bacterium]|nr:ABC transporter substrate-binding protein [Sphingomonadales bacterium]
MIRLIALLMLLALPAAAQDTPRGGLEAAERFGPATAATVLRLRTTTDIDVLGPAIAAFTAARPGLAVEFEQWGSNALYDAARADCAAGRAGADALLSSAVDQLVELVNLGCAQPWRSGATLALPEARRWRDELWGLTREPAVILYNRRLVPPEDVPRSRFDLLDLMRRDDHRYQGRIATYDIEASGLGYLFAFADSLEATSFGAALEGFARAGAVATCCSAEIIEGVSQGRWLIAYNVLGSYAAARPAPEVGVIAPEDYTLILTRAYMIPRAAAAPGPAAELLDFLLGAEGQRLMAARGLILDPDRGNSGEAESTERPIRIGPALLVARDAEKRRAFIRRWRETFPRPTP